jgi:hypothetical protein
VRTLLFLVALLAGSAGLAQTHGPVEHFPLVLIEGDAPAPVKATVEPKREAPPPPLVRTSFREKLLSSAARL